MEHLELGPFACEMEPEEGTRKCGPFGSKGKGPCRMF
jgi:hypothetical protein